MVGLLIMTITIIIYFQFQGNLTDESEIEWQELIVDSKSITSSLITSGSPLNWTNNTVEILGITDGDFRINSTKFARFKNMSYSEVKNVFKTRFDFHFYIKDENNIIFEEYGINASNPDFLVQTTRFVLYNSTIKRMVLHLWKN